MSAFRATFTRRAQSEAKALSRVSHDLMLLKKNPLPGIIIPDDLENLFEFEAHVCGPEDSNYATGLFGVHIKITSSFPFKPPTVKFTSPIFHPNVMEDGSICIDILDDEWYPNTTIGNVLEALQGLMREPNPDSPLNGTASRTMKEPELFRKIVQTWTFHLAGGSISVPEFSQEVEDRMNNANAKTTYLDVISELTNRLWSVTTNAHFIA